MPAKCLKKNAFWRLRVVPVPEVCGGEAEAHSVKMHVPLASQGRNYLEQLIPAERDHWPEIIFHLGNMTIWSMRFDTFRCSSVSGIILPPPLLFY